MPKFAVDSSEGRFLVQAFAEGMLAALGHSPILSARRFGGTVDFDPAAPDKTAVLVTVDAASLEATGDLSKNDRQEIESRTRDEVLEAGKFPQIDFKSSGAEVERVGENQFRLRTSGTFTLHGVEKAEPLDLHLRASQWDLRLRGEVTLRQSAYQIKRVSALGGAIRLKDDLKVSFELVAKLVDP
jgi:polyisoprenoid-binding protein YceI